ncbi:hypothetical protein [Nocardioides sp. CER19]|uniref:hypothetical protein n=1 Tax=Nocardioides sp. CER19 TaxID=3038538 RepID=UPI002449989A|nr:hypothetical protein [Nocardioides sp. CER19]MDH2416073.1 hypothetical protein [Nocardioides sp. CER19]
MSWLALLLVGLGIADLGHSVRPVRWVPECVGAGVVVTLGLLGGLTSRADVVAWIVIALVVIGWGRVVREGFGLGRPEWPLALVGGAVLAAILVSPLAGHVDGPFADWLGELPWARAAAANPDTALLVLGGLLVQLSTGNVVVRLVLAATDTVNPARPDRDASARLKGGRLLGPMERLVIFGLGLSGYVTAASLVIAAKALIRWPELQSFRDAGGSEGPTIDEVTEYFLVGSFVSWLVSLGTLVMVA